MTSRKPSMTSPESLMTSPKSDLTSPKSSTTSPKSLTTSPTPGESDDCHELPPAKAFDPSDEPIRSEGGVVERAVVAARGDADDLVTAPWDANDAVRGEPPLEPRQDDVAATQRARIDGFDDELLPGTDEGMHAVARRREAGTAPVPRRRLPPAPVRREREHAHRPRGDELIENVERERERTSVVKQRKRARKQPRRRLGRRDLDELRLRRLLQKKDAVERRRRRRRQRRLAVPRRAEHPPLAAHVAHDHAVVAHDLDVLRVHPQPPRRRLPRPRLPDEEPPPPARVDDAAGVELDAAPAREEVRDDDFVERIFERVDGAVEDVEY